MNGIMLTVSEIDEENRFYSLPRVMQELEILRTGMLDQKIPRIGDENPYNRTFYEDAISCTLSNAIESGEISEDEYEAIYSLYVF